MSKEKKSILGKEIFAAGVWNEDNYTVSDLHAMARAYNETKDQYKPFFKLGHNADQSLLEEDGLPSAGWVDNLRVEDDKLVCDIIDIPDVIYKLIHEGAYRYVSSEIYWGVSINGAYYERMLTGVALLGADMPAVMGLNDFANLYKLDARHVRTYTIQNNMEAKMPEAIETPAIETPAIETPVIETLIDADATVIETVEVEAIVDANQEMAAMIKDLQDKNTKLEADLVAAHGEAVTYKIKAEESEVDKFLSDIDIAPAAKEYARALVGPEKKEYSLGKETLNKKELLEKIVKIYSIGTVNLDENSVSVVNSDDEQEIEKIRLYAKENGIRFADAYKIIAVDTPVVSPDQNEEE